MNITDFDSLTPREFDEIVKHYARANETVFKNEWERARFISLYTLAPHSKRALKPADICVFDWEKDKQTKELTKKEKEIIIKRGKEISEYWGTNAAIPFQ